METENEMAELASHLWHPEVTAAKQVFC